MAEETVTPIRRRATPKAPPPPQLLLTEPEETVHRVACVLKCLAAHQRITELAWTDDEEFGLFIMLSDLAAALDYAREAACVRQGVAHG